MFLSTNSRKIFLTLASFLICGVVIIVFLPVRRSKLPTGTEDTGARLHYSTYSERAFFDQAFDFSPPSSSQPGREIRGLLFNHHLLAPHFIAQAFLAAQNQKPQTLVILSPNHFMAGTGPILTSRYAWQTPYGELQPDLEIIGALIESGLVKVDEQPFENEMGIKNIVAFAKRVFPDVRFVPLIVKDNTPDFLADSLARALQKALPQNSLVVGSFDFSHYHTLDIANQHDEKSLSAVRSLDFKGTKDLDVDSRPGLRILLEFLSLAKADSFTLLQHSNSALVTKNLTATSTTSYITGYFAK